MLRRSLILCRLVLITLYLERKSYMVRHSILHCTVRVSRTRPKPHRPQHPTTAAEETMAGQLFKPWPQIRMGTWWEEGGVRRTVSQFHEVMGFAGERCGGRRFGAFVKVASQVGRLVNKHPAGPPCSAVLHTETWKRASCSAQRHTLC
jgi:hypothetical protein